MKIWCIDFGEFGIALIEGIDRAKRSQVTKFVDVHGDHSCQHVAYDTHNLDAFVAHLKSMGGTPRGGVLVRNDGFGTLKQMFARGYCEGDAAEATFPEYCERPKAEIEDAVTAADEAPFFDFGAMPAAWEVPAATPRREFVG